MLKDLHMQNRSLSELGGKKRTTCISNGNNCVSRYRNNIVNCNSIETPDNCRSLQVNYDLDHHNTVDTNYYLWFVVVVVVQSLAGGAIEAIVSPHVVILSRAAAVRQSLGHLTRKVHNKERARTIVKHEPLSCPSGHSSGFQRCASNT